VKLDPGRLWPGFDPFKYVLAVVDPVRSVPGIGVDNSDAHYRNYIVGAVSVGYDPFAWGQDHAPDDWVQKMASSIGPDGAGYDGAIAFGWASGLPSSQAIIDAGHNLTAQVLLKVQSFTGLQENDVVDVHMIGHSRGSVVISLAMQDLLESDKPQLHHGYMKMTLLDPHPANLKYGLSADINLAVPPVGIPVLIGYALFEGIVQDPPVYVPGRVNEIEQIWQQNPWYLCPVGKESLLNLWGLDGGSIVYGDRSVPLVSNYMDLTGMQGIGHSEVHDYYQGNFIPVPPGPPPGGGATVRRRSPFLLESSAPVMAGPGSVVPPDGNSSHLIQVDLAHHGRLWSGEDVAFMDHHLAAGRWHEVRISSSHFRHNGPLDDFFAGYEGCLFERYG
jgi:hypothetical protein